MKTLERLFAEKLLKIKAIKLQPANPFTWASGWKSPFYCDNRKTLSYPSLRNFVKIEIARLILENFVVAWLVPGSWMVDAQIREEGLDKVLEEAGFAIRQPGCSACLAMNDDKVPAGKYAVSTSNRNFEGRQGPGARTLLASPLVAAAAAVTGVITDPREFI